MNLDLSEYDLSQITDEELIELERLLLERGLYTLDDDTNPNYRVLYDCITTQQFDLRGELKENSYAGAILEGSSRSGKTWSGVDMIICIALFIDPGCKINIYREFFADFRDTLYDDFKRRLNDFGLNNPFEKAETVRTFKINGTRISFKGCDRLGSKHGAGADYVFFNEMMHIPLGVFKQAVMRCRKFWWGDYNPSVTQHWVFDSVLTRSDVKFIRTTFKDNPFITTNERNEILSSDPWETGSYEVKDGTVFYKGKPVDEKNQPPPNVENITQGTADEFHWKVYGLGLRGAMKGRIFKYVNYIDEMPTHLDYHYGIDFGFTVDPTAITRLAEDEHNIYIELLSYSPIETPAELSAYMDSIGINTKSPITVDSSDRYVSGTNGVIEMARSLVDDYGWVNLKKVSKTKSVMFWLNSMKKKRIHVIKNAFLSKAKAEFENYRMKEINGVAINQPIDKLNHCIDSARYGHMSFNAPEVTLSGTTDLRSIGINH